MLRKCTYRRIHGRPAPAAEPNIRQGQCGGHRSNISQKRTPTEQRQKQPAITAKVSLLARPGGQNIQNLLTLTRSPDDAAAIIAQQWVLAFYAGGPDNSWPWYVSHSIRADDLVSTAAKATLYARQCRICRDKGYIVRGRSFYRSALSLLQRQLCGSTANLICAALLGNTNRWWRMTLRPCAPMSAASQQYCNARRRSQGYRKLLRVFCTRQKYIAFSTRLRVVTLRRSKRICGFSWILLGVTVSTLRPSAAWGGWQTRCTSGSRG